jgi:hypothetical protein
VRRTWGHVLTCSLGLGCGLKPYTLESASGGEASSGTGTGDATLGGSVTGAGTSTGGMAEGTGTGSSGDDSAGVTSGDDSAGGTSGGDPCAPSKLDLGSDTWKCNRWTQDCPEGCKCAPHSGDGDDWPESLKCKPVMPNAGGPNDPCTIVGSGFGGNDSCAEGLLCWNVRPDTGFGRCVALCEGSPDQPYCTDPELSCVYFGDPLFLCLELCHPLEQACMAGESCLPIWSDPAAFVCLVDGSGTDGQAFDVCEYVHACDPGLLCANPALANECDAQAAGCCLPFCELSKPECPGVGLECLPWFEEGMAPPGFEELGICGVPQ